MPLYDFRCKCGHLESTILTFDKYDVFESMKCTKCTATLTKDDREICSNIQAVYTGPGKGNFNSGDFT